MKKSTKIGIAYALFVFVVLGFSMRLFLKENTAHRKECGETKKSNRAKIKMWKEWNPEDYNQFLSSLKTGDKIKITVILFSSDGECFSRNSIEAEVLDWKKERFLINYKKDGGIIVIVVTDGLKKFLDGEQYPITKNGEGSLTELIFEKIN